MSFPDELTAFRKYAELYPGNTTLLVDTYDTLRSGVPNAIKVFEELREKNKMPKNYGIRLASPKEGQKVFQSIAVIAQYVTDNRTK